MNPSVKVLYISHEGDAMKGSTYSLLNMISALSGSVTPVVVVPSDGEACREFERRGIKYHVVPFNLSYTRQLGAKRILTMAPRLVRDTLTNNRAVKQIAALLQNEGISLVHSNSAAVGIGNQVAALLNVKHLWHLREFLDLDFNLSPLTGWKIFLKNVHQSDALVSITKSIFEHYKCATHPNAYTIFDAVRKGDQKVIDHNKEDYLLFCGYVVSTKGIEQAIKGFAAVKPRYPQLKLKVAGAIQPGYAPKLEALINQLGISGEVEFLGFQKDVNDLMAKARCLLMCSKKEAQGRVTIEAMFQGCPVIGFASGGTLEIITDNVTGLLYQSDEELANKITGLLDDYSAADALIKQAQNFVLQNFTEEVYAQQLLKVYSTLK